MPPSTRPIAVLAMRLGVAMTLASTGGRATAQAPPPATTTQTPATQPAAKSEADLALEPISQDFRTLFGSLKNRGGIAPEDRDVIRELRDQAAAFNARWPDQQRGLALELQLSVWLGEQDRVHDLFGRLVELNPDDSRIGLYWASYFRRLDDSDQAEDAFTQVLARYPDDQQVRLGWANYLKGRNRYGPALEVIGGFEFDPAETPQVALVLSECLFGEQRYQEALDALESIPQEVVSGDQFVSAQITRDKPTRQQYVELWAQEQAIRQAEAEADDLPRVELILGSGRIVVELYENEAPNTVANYISLVESGFYTGTKFHRVMPNFMAQGGDPNSRPGASGVPGQGSPGYRIPDEHDREDRRNHFSGSLAMAKTGAPNTGGCQFYFTHTATPWLNGKHTVFGHVIEGLEVARAINQDDVLVLAAVLRKRDHEYDPETLPEDGSTTQPGTQPDQSRRGLRAPATAPDGAPAIQPDG